MDGHKFDALARAVALTTNRRGFLRAALAGGFTLALGGLGFGNRSLADENDATPVAETPIPVDEPTAPPTPTETATPTEVVLTETPIPTIPTETVPTATPTSRADRGTPTPTARPTTKSGSEPSTQATPNLTLTPTSGKPGESIRATISGFKNRETVTLLWFDGSKSTTLFSGRASSSGRLETSFDIPKSPVGQHVVRASGGSGSKDDARATVRRRVVVSPVTAIAGDTITTNIHGFASRVNVEIRLYADSTVGSTSTVVKSGTTSSIGSLSLAFTAPANALLGKHRVEVKETVSGGSAAAFVTLQIACNACGDCYSCAPDQLGDLSTCGTCSSQCLTSALCTEARKRSAFIALDTELRARGFVPKGTPAALEIVENTGIRRGLSIPYAKTSRTTAVITYFPEGPLRQIAYVYGDTALRYGLAVDGDGAVYEIARDGSTQIAWDQAECGKCYERCATANGSIGNAVICGVLGAVVCSRFSGPVGGFVCALVAGAGCNAGGAKCNDWFCEGVGGCPPYCDPGCQVRDVETGGCKDLCTKPNTYCINQSCVCKFAECGSACCADGQVCQQGVCQAKCTSCWFPDNDRQCFNVCLDHPGSSPRECCVGAAHPDGFCCPNGESCCDGTCCPNGKCCAGTCCGLFSECCNGVCCASGQGCCDGVCCPSGTFCCNGACIANSDPCCDSTSSYPCGESCCPNDMKCCGGACQDDCCPPNQERCGDACCPIGQTCCFGACIDDGYACCDPTTSKRCGRNCCLNEGLCCLVDVPGLGYQYGFCCVAGRDVCHPDAGCLPA